MPTSPRPSVAIVRDWLTVVGGADRVMDAALELFPGAPVYALVYDRGRFDRMAVARHPVHTSFLQRMPGGISRHRALLPLMPFAVEQFDLSAFDLVLSFSHAVAKGALTRPDQLHICYVFTPMRYAWDLHADCLKQARLDRGLRGWLARGVLHYVRLWDQTTAQRPDVMIAASRFVAQRIWKLYRRRAAVIYPPVDVARFTPRLDREPFYLTVSRLVPYKRIDLVIGACNRLQRRLVVVGDGPERKRLARMAGPTVTLLGEQPDEVVADLMSRCRAFVFAAEEDFGIVPVEAQAAGAPVVAYGRGGVTETIVPGETGIFFERQDEESVSAALVELESAAHRFHPELLARAAGRFGRERFVRELEALVAAEYARFKEQDHAPSIRIGRSTVAV
jgi:glycosyltransferase involved in cell wall biosynthesis